MEASARGDLAVVEMLLRHNASVDQGDNVSSQLNNDINYDCRESGLALR